MLVKLKTFVGGTLLLVTLAAIAATPALAQTPKFAVIDSDRIVMESQRGQAALEQIKARQEAKMAEGRAMQQEIQELAKRIEEGGLSLAPERLDELKKDYEDKAIALRRFQEDADLELNKLRDSALAAIEKDVISIIDTMGKEGGYTLIFNKFRSGLLFADDAIDITADVIQRFDSASGG